MEDGFKNSWMVPAVSGAFALLVAADLINDYAHGSSPNHLILEALLLVISGTVFVLGIQSLVRAKQDIRALHVDLESLHHEKEQWKAENQKLLAGLSVKIEQQFAHWQLTEAEIEVGFLLLKGLSLQEIADIRSTKLKTVQQQSQSTYKKTGLASRAELAAFFLEDLLPPKDHSSHSS